MNETLQQAMLSLIDSTVSTVQDGVAFLKQEIPDVITQLLTWHMVESLLYFFVFILLSLSCVIVVYFVFRKKIVTYLDTSGYPVKMQTGPRSLWDEGKEGYVIIGGLSVIGSVGFALLSLTQLVWIKILIAPKLYLLEYAATLMK